MKREEQLNVDPKDFSIQVLWSFINKLIVEVTVFPTEEKVSLTFILTLKFKTTAGSCKERNSRRGTFPASISRMTYVQS